MKLSPHVCFVIISITCIFCMHRQTFAQVYRIDNKQSEALVQLLQEVQNGDTIIITGKYHGNFEIKRSIQLLSDSNAVLTSDSHGSILRIFAADTVVKGLDFDNSGKDISAKDACVFLEKGANNTKVLRNQFNDCSFAIWVDQTPTVRIEDNTIIGTQLPIVSDRGNGIQLFNTHGSTVQNNYISDGRDGIYISNSSNVVIKNNVMHHTRFGIHYMYNHHCEINGNMATYSSVGAALMFSNDLLVISNEVKGNRTYGLLLRDVMDSNIVNNISTGNQVGMFLGSSYFNNIHQNCIASNQIAVHITNGSDDNAVYGNDFINNKLQIKFLNNKSIVWSKNGIGNYWSHYVRLGINRSGVNNTKFYVTNISDWLVSSYPELNVMLYNPAMVLLKKIENEFPIIRKPAVIDEGPLMSPVICNNITA